MNVDNNLGKLNDYLFDQMDRLNDEDLEGETLKEEIERAKAVKDVATSIISNGNLVLNAEKYNDDKWNAEAKKPKMLEG